MASDLELPISVYSQNCFHMWDQNKGWERCLEGRVPQQLHQHFLECSPKQSQIVTAPSGEHFYLIYRQWHSLKLLDLKYWVKTQYFFSLAKSKYYISLYSILFSCTLKLNICKQHLRTEDKVFFIETYLWIGQRFGKSRHWASSVEKDAQTIKGHSKRQSNPLLCLTGASDLLLPFLTDACPFTL